MYRLVVILSAVLMLAGCEQIDRLSRVTVEAKSETTVQGTGLPTSGILGFSEFSSFDINSSASFQNSDATKNNIGEDSYVTGFTLRVKSPDKQTLQFIDSMQIFIDKDDDRTVETEVAFIGDSQDTNVRELDLKVNDDRAIGQYLRAEETVIRVIAEGNPPNQDTTIEAEIHFDVNLVW